jgi:uncharacterized DUF497 family protein
MLRMYIYERVPGECGSAGMLERAAAMLRERGFDFELATRVFDGAALEPVDSRRHYGERRVIALGKAQEIPLTVVYTDGAEAGGAINRRIILTSDWVPHRLWIVEPGRVRFREADRSAV